jgi:hypothetical protein
MIGRIGFAPFQPGFRSSLRQGSQILRRGATFGRRAWRLAARRSTHVGCRATIARSPGNPEQQSGLTTRVDGSIAVFRSRQLGVDSGNEACAGCDTLKESA